MCSKICNGLTDVPERCACRLEKAVSAEDAFSCREDGTECRSRDPELLGTSLALHG